MTNVLWVLLVFFAPYAHSACTELIKFHGTVDLVQKKLADPEISSKKTQVCVSPDDANPNLELVFRTGKKVFKTKIYSSLDGYYDVQDKNKKMTGGKYPIRYIFIDSWAPTWAKGSSLTITDIQEKKILMETKL